MLTSSFSRRHCVGKKLSGRGTGDLVVIVQTHSHVPLFRPPGLADLPHLPKFAPLHVHCISDAIQPSLLWRPLLFLTSIFSSFRDSSSESAGDILKVIKTRGSHTRKTIVKDLGECEDQVKKNIWNKYFMYRGDSVEVDVPICVTGRNSGDKVTWRFQGMKFRLGSVVGCFKRYYRAWGQETGPIVFSEWWGINKVLGVT